MDKRGLGLQQQQESFKRTKRKKVGEQGRKDEDGRRQRRRFLKAVRDYLCSDAYMYAPLISLSPAPTMPPASSRKPPPPPKGPFEFIERATTAISIMKLADQNDPQHPEKGI